MEERRFLDGNKARRKGGLVGQKWDVQLTTSTWKGSEAARLSNCLGDAATTTRGIC